MKELDTYFEKYWDKLDEIKLSYDNLFSQILEELEIVCEKEKINRKEITLVLESIDQKLNKLITATNEYNKTFNEKKVIKIPMIGRKFQRRQNTLNEQRKKR